MTDAFIEDFMDHFDDSRFPSDFLRDYEMMECLSQNEAGETLLVKDRQTGEHCVAKCYTDRSFLSRTSESELLKKFHHKGLPVYVGEYQNENMLCIIRSYARGASLDQLVREQPLTGEQAMAVGVQLCDILIDLHGQTPPIIHRDIKPQNIIVDEHWRVTLIDFGTSRTFDQAAHEDTLCLGTRYYAAPEQYGFAQTDARTDIFALGVLLCWMLTGGVEVERAKKAVPNRRLANIVAKCTAFAPKDRYKNAAAVRDALTGRTDRLRLIAVMGIALVVFIAIFYFLNFARPQSEAPAGIAFKEPLIEAAVRLALDKNKTDLVTEEDLATVSELLIFGDKAAANEAAFKSFGDSFVKNDGTIRRGDIDSLEDLSKLKNLRRISLVYQEIKDLTPLAGLATLESIDLRHNPIEQVAPLSKVTSLTSLFIFDTLVSDLTALRDCPRLSTLDIGYTLVKTTTALDGLDSLQILMIRKAPLQSLDHIQTHPMLEEIYLSETQLLDLSPLLELPRLELVEVDEAMRPSAEAISERARFKILYP